MKEVTIEKDKYTTPDRTAGDVFTGGDLSFMKKQGSADKSIDTTDG